MVIEAVSQAMREEVRACPRCGRSVERGPRAKWCSQTPRRLGAGRNGMTANGASWQYNVPKRDLASALAVALQSGRLRIASALPHAQTLLSELLAFRAKITPAGAATYESWRERDHE